MIQFTLVFIKKCQPTKDLQLYTFYSGKQLYMHFMGKLYIERGVLGQGN